MQTILEKRGQRRAVRAFSIAVSAIWLAFNALAVSAANPPSGSATAWGYNGLGCLGNGTTSSSSKPIVVKLPSDVTARVIAAGQFHNLAITDDGVYFWGDGIALPTRVSFPQEVTSA